MKKFCFAAINILLIVSIALSVGFGIGWNNERKSNENSTPNEQVEVIERDLEKIKSELADFKASYSVLEEEKNNAVKNVEKLKVDKADLIRQRNELTSENNILQSQLDMQIKLTEEQIAEKEQQIADLEAQIAPLRTRISELEAQVQRLEENAKVYDMTPVNIQFSEENLSRSHEIVTPNPDGNGSSVRSWSLRSLLGKSSSNGQLINNWVLKESYIIDNELIFFVEGGSSLGADPAGDVLCCYTSFIFDESLNPDEVTGDWFTDVTEQQFLEESLYPIKSSAYTFWTPYMFKSEKYMTSESNVKVREYFLAHEDCEYNFFGVKCSLNDMYLSFSSDSTTTKFTIMLRKNNKPLVHREVITIDRPLSSEENVIIEFFEKFRIKPKSFDKASWEEISEYSAKISENNYTSFQVKEMYGWDIGDEKDFKLSTGENVTVQIIGFNHDDKSDGTGKAGITLSFKDCSENSFPMHNENTSISWNLCSMRNQVLPEILNQFPEEMKSVIKTVDKKTGSSKELDSIEISQDNLFLFSYEEIMGTYIIEYYKTSIPYKSCQGEGSQYEYYAMAPIPLPSKGDGEFTPLKGNEGTFYTEDFKTLTQFENPFGAKVDIYSSAVKYYNNRVFKKAFDKTSVSGNWWLRSYNIISSSSTQFAIFNSFPNYCFGMRICSASNYILCGFCI